MNLFEDVCVIAYIYIYIYIYVCVCVCVCVCDCVYIKIGSLALWVECSHMIRETWVQSPVASYQKLKKWYLIPPCLKLSNIRYISRVK